MYGSFQSKIYVQCSAQTLSASFDGFWQNIYTSVQLSSVAQLCLTLCDPMNRRTPGLRVHHQLSEFTQTHVH